MWGIREMVKHCEADYCMGHADLEREEIRPISNILRSYAVPA